MFISAALGMYENLEKISHIETSGRLQQIKINHM
jgi:hypothetical protein